MKLFNVLKKQHLTKLWYWLKQRKPKVFYTCGTNWLHGPRLKLYTTVEGLKKDRDCWEECGIVEIKAKEVKWIVEENMFGDNK